MVRVYSKEEVSNEPDGEKFVKAGDHTDTEMKLYRARMLVAANIPSIIDQLVFMFGEGPHADIHHERDEVEISRLKKEIEFAVCYITAMLPVYTKHKKKYPLARAWLKKNQVRY